MSKSVKLTHYTAHEIPESSVNVGLDDLLRRKLSGRGALIDGFQVLEPGVADSPAYVILNYYDAAHGIIGVLARVTPSSLHLRDDISRKPVVEIDELVELQEGDQTVQEVVFFGVRSHHIILQSGRILRKNALQQHVNWLFHTNALQLEIRPHFVERDTYQGNEVKRIRLSADSTADQSSPQFQQDLVTPTSSIMDVIARETGMVDLPEMSRNGQAMLEIQIKWRRDQSTIERLAEMTATLPDGFEFQVGKTWVDADEIIDHQTVSVETMDKDNKRLSTSGMRDAIGEMLASISE